LKQGEKTKEGFPAAGLSVWEQAASEELQGANPWKKLTRDVQGLSVKPFYTKEDAQPDPLRLAPAKGTFHGPRTWYNCPRVIVKNAAEANATALDHLTNGADGIFFELSGPVDFHQLLQKIEWPFCSLNFLAPRAGAADAAALEGYLKTFSGDALGAWYAPAASTFPPVRNFRTSGYFLASSGSPADDIATSFLSIFQHQRERKTPAAGVALCVALGTDFFFEIARLRAVRQVWHQLLATTKAGEHALYVHACSPAWSEEAYAPHGNMIRATTTAMAAILGGCDALTIDAESHQEMPQRIARNVAILLREESRFAKVADPLAGSYFVDDLAGQLASKAWSILEPQLAR